jgi:hypothetical protein
MKKITFLMLFFVALSLVFTGCKKPTGTFTLNNDVEYSMSVEWCDYNMSVGAYGYNSYTVTAGGGTASVWANGYGYWGDIYIDVPEDGTNGVYMYWSKDKSNQPTKGLKKK